MARRLLHARAPRPRVEPPRARRSRAPGPDGDLHPEGARGGLLLGAVVALAAFGFLRLAHYVRLGEASGLDERLLLALRTSGDPTDLLGPPWLEEMVRDVTALGGVAVLALAVFTAAGTLLCMGRRRTAAFLLLDVAGGAVLSLFLKELFDRPRPALVPHGSVVLTASFPSGHAMLSSVTYLTIGALATRVEGQRRLRRFVLGMAVLVTVLVGVSRVWLGVHWPSDVLGGWAVGALWAALAWTVARRLQREGDIEPAPPRVPD